MRLFRTWDETRKIPEKGRLAWYSGRADAEHWTGHWNVKDVHASLKSAEKGSYPYRSLFRRFLPRDKPILEGGCGVGHILFGLKKDGYNVIGVELSYEIVRMVKEIAPEPDIIVGDIQHLHFPDGYFGGYVSLGVIEHILEGPEKALAEANRVLCHGGILFISVPYFSPLRKLKARWNLYPRPSGPVDTEDFYQFAFSKSELVRLLNQSGFEILSIDYSNVLIGVGREMGRIGERLRRYSRSAILISYLEHFRTVRFLIGHGIIIIGRKVGKIS
jgi:SAM-dependent methyltransferase